MHTYVVLAVISNTAGTPQIVAYGPWPSYAESSRAIRDRLLPGDSVSALAAIRFTPAAAPVWETRTERWTVARLDPAAAAFAAAQPESTSCFGALARDTQRNLMALVGPFVSLERARDHINRAPTGVGVQWDVLPVTALRTTQPDPTVIEIRQPRGTRYFGPFSGPEAALAWYAAREPDRITDAGSAYLVKHIPPIPARPQNHPSGQTDTPDDDTPEFGNAYPEPYLLELLTPIGQAIVGPFQTREQAQDWLRSKPLDDYSAVFVRGQRF